MTEVLGSEVVSISPYGDSASPTYGMWMHIFEPLISYNEVKSVNEPLLATGWTNPDPNTWIFTLRQDVKFHDGSPFTSEDVVHSYKRMRDDPTSQQRSTFSNVDGIEAPDKYTVRLHTKEPDAALIFRLNNRMITSKTAFDQYGSGEEADKHPNGTGPWLFKEYVPGQRVVMEKNPNYWGTERKATFDELVVRFMKEPQAAVTGLLNGEIDVIPNVPPQLVDQVANSGRAHIASAPGTRLMFLGMNSAYKPWDNVKLRQAINYAIDKEGIVKGILSGRASELKTPIGPGMYAYDPNLQPQYTYDPAKAEAATGRGRLSEWAGRRATVAERPLPEGQGDRRGDRQHARTRSDSDSPDTPEWGKIGRTSRPGARRSTCSAAAPWRTRASIWSSTSRRASRRG